MMLSLAQEAVPQTPPPPPAPASPPAFRIFIHLPLTEKLFSGLVKPDTRMSTLKNAACAREGLVPRETCFFFAGKEVNIEKHACELNIKENDVLVVLARSFLNPTRESLQKTILDKVAAANRAARPPARRAARHATKLPRQPAAALLAAPAATGASGALPAAPPAACGPGLAAATEPPRAGVADSWSSFWKVLNEMIVMESTGLAKPTAQVKRRFLEALGEHQPAARTAGEPFFENLIRFVTREWTSFPRDPEPDQNKWTLTDILDQLRRLSKTESAPEHLHGPPPPKRVKL